MKGVRARCPLGGFAPCVDDLCRGGDQTVCMLQRGFDFCDHGFDPETCPECWAEDHDGDEWLDDGHP